MIPLASSGGTVMIRTPETVSETTGQRIAITPSVRTDNIREWTTRSSGVCRST
jgi:hypothetical protein